MQNTQLESLSEGDAELATICIATGPGEGIQAMQLIVRDENAVEQYGEYPKPVTFEQAVNLADLERLAREYLEQNNGPLQALSVRAAFESGYDPDIEQGDTVTFASVEAGLNVTERIVEINYDADGVSFSLKAPKADLTQAILDKFDEGDRAARALGLPAPVGFSVTGARPGVRLKFNPYVGSRAQGVEIHASLKPNFSPDAGTLVRRTGDTEVHLASVSFLPLGTRWYLKVASYAGAERGEFTDELSAIAGYITTDVLDPSIEEKLDQAASDQRIGELIEEVNEGQIFTGTVASFSVDGITDVLTNFVTKGVKPGWNFKLLSGPLKYRAFTVTAVSASEVKLSPNVPSNIILSGSTYELASSPRITTLGTTGIVVELSKPPSESTFSSIKQMSNEIALAVVRDAGRYAQLSILEDELDLRVVKGDMISAINLDPAGVRIVGNRIQLSGDTQISGNLAITGGKSELGNRVRVLDAGNGEKVALGNISGKPWGSGFLPANTWGVWGDGAGAYLRGYMQLVGAGDWRFSLGSEFVGAYGTVDITANVTLDGGGSPPRPNIAPTNLVAGESFVMTFSVHDVTQGNGLLHGYSCHHQAQVNGGGFRDWQNRNEITKDTIINAVRAACMVRVYNPTDSGRTLSAFMGFSFQIYRIG